MKLKSVLNTIIARGTLAAGFLAATLVAVAQQQPPQQPPPQPQPGQPQPRQQQPADQQQLIERMQQTRGELDQVMSRLTEVQEKANKEKDVKEVLEPLEEAIYGTMKQKAPDLEQQVDRLEELTAEIRESGELNQENQEEPQSDEFAKNLEEYQQLKRQLGPVEQQALQDPGVSEKLQTYQSQLIETMNEIEPKTQDLLNRQGELVTELQAIQQSVQQNQQPQPLPQGSPEG